MQELDIQRIDFHQLSQKEFLQKYPQYSTYKLHKLFGFKDRKKLIELTEKQAREKIAQNKFNNDFERVISENDRKLCELFNLSPKTIKGYLLDGIGYSELFKGEIINGKYVVKSTRLVVKYL